MKSFISTLLIAAMAAAPMTVLGGDSHAAETKPGATTKPDIKKETITAEQVPEVIAKAFAKDFPGVTAKKIIKETYPDGIVHYEFKWADKDGKEHEAEYNTEGDKLDKH